MRTYEEVYNDMNTLKNDNRFTIKQCINAYMGETNPLDKGSWNGTTQQLLELRSLQEELTGIRPGSCSNCNIEVMRNMIRWLTKYESEHPKEIEVVKIKTKTKNRGFK